MGAIFCGRHFENSLKVAMYEQIFAVNILVCYKHVYQHPAKVIGNSLRRNLWL